MLDYSDSEGHGGDGGMVGVVADMEAGFQGAFDNYASVAGDGHDPQEQLAAMAGFGSTFQGVEPMGELIQVYDVVLLLLLCCCRCCW